MQSSESMIFALKWRSFGWVFGRRGDNARICNLGVAEDCDMDTQAGLFGVDLPDGNFVDRTRLHPLGKRCYGA